MNRKLYFEKLEDKSMMSINLPGDLTHDNTVNIQDVSAMMTAISDQNSYKINTGISDADFAKIGDSNRDNQVNNLDLQQILITLAQSPTWFDTNITDPVVKFYGDKNLQDGILNRTDMIDLLHAVADEGPLADNTFTDLKAIANNTSLFGGSTYITQISSDVILGSPANMHYQTQTLGNLQTGSTPDQLNNLVNKWFLGLDHPVDGGYAYQKATGSLFGPNGPTINDPKQGGLGNCAMIATLGEIADRSPSIIVDMFVDNGDGTYGVKLYYGNPIYVTVDSYLPSNGESFVFDGAGRNINDPNNTLWSQLAEKGAAQYWETRSGQNNYENNAYLYGYECLQIYTGKTTSNLNSVSNSLKNTVIHAWNDGRLIDFQTQYTQPAGSPIVANHEYALVGYDALASTFTLFNPWGIEQGLITLTWNQVMSYFIFVDYTTN